MFENFKVADKAIARVMAIIQGWLCGTSMTEKLG